MIRRCAVIAIVAVMALSGVRVSGDVPDVATNTWAPGPALSGPRHGATATALPDGSVLVAGGRGVDGPLAAADVISASGAVLPAAPLGVARADHAAAPLPDGRVLVAGGHVTAAQEDGSFVETVTGSVEVFDPGAGGWYAAGSLAYPRAGATAATLPDGRVAIVGGRDESGPVLAVEIYDPSVGGLVAGGSLAMPRADAAVAVTRSGHIVVAGGTVDGVAQASADVIDPVRGTVATVGLLEARAGASATALVTDTVLIAGGTNEQGVLASAEVLDPETGYSVASATLASPRSGHQAFRLEHNGGVLLVGGTGADGSTAPAELVLPWMNVSQPVGSPTPRTGVAGAPTSREGVHLVAGGRDGALVHASTEYFGFATVKTDKDDYAPGEFVTITGTGWQPGETVQLWLHEVGTGAPDMPLNAVADEHGNIFNDFWAPNQSHIGVRFHLTATGAASSAQTTFTDGRPTGVTVTPESSDPITPGGDAIYTVRVTLNNQATNCITSLSAVLMESLPPAAPALTFTFDPATVSGSNVVAESTLTVTVPTGMPSGDYLFNVIADGNLGSGCAGATATTESPVKLVVASEDTTRPAVTINRADGQADPTNALTINFTVEFSEPVSGFETGDVTLSGTADAKTAVVTGSGTTYNVAVSGMTQSGTVIASIGAGVAQDSAGNLNEAAPSAAIVTYDITPPTVTVNQASGQGDPTNTSPIIFAVEFSEPVSGFESSDVLVSGTAEATTVQVSGSGTSYEVKVSGMTTDGTVVVTIPAGAATDAAGNGNSASTSTDNEVTYDTTPPEVTVNQAVGQADPTNSPPIRFTVVFSEPVSDFTSADVAVSGTAGATTATVTGSGTTYTVEVSGMTTDGTVVVTVPAGVAKDAAGNSNNASTSTDNEVTYDITPPEVTVNQAVGQADPTNASPINFTVVFSEPVSDFTSADVTLSGTAGATTAVVTGSGTTYNVAVSGMTTDGTVVVTVPAGVATDAAGNANNASTSTDNEVTYDITPPEVTVNQADGQADPTNQSPINFTVVFSEPVSGFDSSDVTISGTAGATTAVVTGSETTYNVAVSGMTTDGTVVVSIGAGVVTDAAGNQNNASTSTDNEVIYDTTPPTGTILINGGATYTNSADVTLALTCTDALTGCAQMQFSQDALTFTDFEPIASSKMVTLIGADGDKTVYVRFRDGAGNVSTAVSDTIVLDTTPPVITIVAPADNAAYGLNQAVTADYSCSDVTSGIATCSGPVANGALVDTSTVGSHAFTVTATDKAGNTAFVTHSYGVNYVFNGFFSPVLNGAWNVVNAGRAIPLKWQLTDALGSPILDLGTVDSITYYQVPCAGEGIANPIEGLADDAGASDLRITGTEYHFNWKTAKDFANKCFELRVTLDDGSAPHVAKFKFAK
ncbi:MAG TPA: Ig-like domain-containing protein [Vicinamibacterales bacterium]